jgi:hypothetical protein
MTDDTPPQAFWEALARAKVTLGADSSLVQLEMALVGLDRVRPLALQRPYALAILEGLAKELRDAVAATARSSGVVARASVYNAKKKTS